MGACCGGQTGLWMEAWVCKMGKEFTLLIWRQICYPLCLLSDSPLPPPFPCQTHPPTHTNAVSRGQTPSRAGLTLSACCGKRWGCHSHSSLPPFPLLSFCCCRWCFASGRVVPVQCDPSTLGASRNCRALVALSGISFFFRKWLTTVVSRLLFSTSSQKHCKYTFHCGTSASVKLICLG